MSRNQGSKPDKLVTQGTSSHSRDVVRPERAERAVVLKERNSHALVPRPPQPNPRYISDDHEHSERTGRNSSSRNDRRQHSGGSRSRHRHGSARTTPSEPVDEVHEASDGSNVVHTEYSDITAHGSGFTINGFIGQQTVSSKYTGLHSNSNGTVLNGGIHNTTTNDIEALKALRPEKPVLQPTRRNSRQLSGKERKKPKGSCCVA